MRYILPTALIVSLLAPCVSDAQVKKSGGLFGFNRNEEQISSGLFPNEMTTQQVSQTSVAPVSSAPAPPTQASDNDGIFRGGSPGPIAPVSYTIQDGQKVEKDGNKSEKKSSFFGFGKKEKTEASEAPIVTPVPPSTPYFATTDAPVAAAPEPAPAPPVERPAPVQMASNEDVPAIVEDTPTFKTDEKESKSGGFFSFFSRKKSEPEPVAEMPTVSTPTEVVENTTDNVVAAATDSADNVFEVPSMPSTSNEPEKEKKTIAGTLLSPVSKIRPPKKELDFTGAETIISDGEIVNDDGQSLTDRIVTTQGDGRKDPPQIVNGVKTYSSWEDVEGSSVSAAEKILKQIR